MRKKMKNRLKWYTFDYRFWYTFKLPLTYETIFDIGCRNAAGLATESDVVDAIWSDFETPMPGVLRKAIDGFNMLDGVEMRYWADPATVCQDPQALLIDPAGNGACGAWSFLFALSLYTQGINGALLCELECDPLVNPLSEGFLVKNWEYDRHIRTGPDGIRQSSEIGDDYAVFDVGNGLPDALCINPGSDGVLNTTADGDDGVVFGVVTTGPNGRCETTAVGDDIQTIPLNQGSPSAACVTPGADGILNSTTTGDDTYQQSLFEGTNYPYALLNYVIPYGDFTNQPGVEGQGNSEPPPGFENHYIVRFDNKLYDPSYGAGPFSNEVIHENAAIDGINSGNRAKVSSISIQELTYTYYQLAP